MHFHVFANGGGVDINVHNAGLGRKSRQPAGNAVVKARAHAHEHVAVVDGQIGRICAVHAHHAQPQGVCGRKAPKPHERAGNRNAQLAGKPCESLGRIGQDNPAASQNNRAFSLGQFFHRAAQLVEVGFVGGVVAAHVDVFRPDKFCPFLHDILGQVNQHRAGATRPGKVKCLADGKRQLGDVLYQKVVLGAGPGNAHNIHFLKGIVANQLGRNLPGKNHQRN